ncbi:MAG: hypothetical protein Tsb008_18750 [Rhodothalassiaceae bacterium]
MRSPIANRLAALALLLLSLALAYMLLFAPVTDGYAAARRALEKDRMLLERYRRVAASADAIEQQASAIRAARRDSGVFLDGSTDALAAAALQNELGAAAARAGGDLRSVQSLAPEPADGMNRIRLRLQLVADIRTLTAFLHEIETGYPLLFVDEIKLRTRLERVSVENDVLEVTEEFLVDIALSGYRSGGLT